MQSQDQIRITRERLGQIAILIGTGGLLLGIIALIWSGSGTISTLLLIVGGIGLAVWVILSPDDLRALLTGRQARFGTMSILSTVLLVSMVILVYSLVQGTAFTLDLTESREFTLSRETLDLLDRLDQPVQITGFYSSNALQLRELDDQIFRLYEDASGGLISREYIDPTTSPIIAQNFGFERDADVFVSFLDENGAVDFNSVTRIVTESSQERNMTLALLRLMNSNAFSVAFEVGYGVVDPLDTSLQGLSNILNGLDANGVNVEPLSLPNLIEAGEPIPPGRYDAIVLTRIRNQIPQEAIDLLDAYVQDGGGLFITADALFIDDPFLAEESRFNQYLWETFGLRMLNAVVVDYAVNDGQSELNVLSATISSNEIGARLNDPENINTATLFRVARAIEVDSTPPVTNGLVIDSAPGPASYGETDLDLLRDQNAYSFDVNEDYAGPMTLVAWAHDQNSDARLLLIGDSDFLTNGQVSPPNLGNGILFTDGIAWLTGFGEQITFAPEGRVTNLPALLISTQTIDQIAFFTVVLLPGTMLLLGFGVWYRRSRR